MRINVELLSTLKKMIRPQARNVQDVEDILQNVLVKILKSGDAVSVGSFLPWLQTVCRTTSIDFYRKNKTKHSALNSDLERANPVVSDNNAPTDLARCIRPLLGKLSSEDSLVLKAVELDGTSQTELAERLNLNYSAIKSKVQRARKKLKEEILECCSVMVDKRNTPIEVRSKKKNDCC